VKRPDALAASLLVLAVLVPLAGFAAQALLVREVTVIVRRNDPAEVEEWRRLRDVRDDPAEIYGVTEPGGPRRVVLPPWERRVDLRPLPEAPDRLLLFVDRHPGVRLLAPRVLVVPAVVGGVLLALLGVWRWRVSGGAP
jgi:hypothetical protein